MEQELLTSREVQQRLKVRRTTVYDLLESGALMSVKIGAARRVYIGDLEAFIESLVGQAETKAVTNVG